MAARFCTGWQDGSGTPGGGHGKRRAAKFRSGKRELAVCPEHGSSPGTAGPLPSRSSFGRGGGVAVRGSVSGPGRAQAAMGARRGERKGGRRMQQLGTAGRKGARRCRGSCRSPKRAAWARPCLSPMAGTCGESGGGEDVGRAPRTGWAVFFVARFLDDGGMATGARALRVVAWAPGRGARLGAVPCGRACPGVRRCHGAAGMRAAGCARVGQARR
ncbi:hypothetical protein E2562_022024 [Oryza meyeriana var. granulata]|uniref:Uncharacterized protein n=1 Tax=Oryza meyeriana var. granulata TaxID=110450 RepID=A0A6G1ENJ0_9ORYZ|nr:hypothetical protein E2562_022024 [Oryza meyeriana var. granulata]